MTEGNATFLQFSSYALFLSCLVCAVAWSLVPVTCFAINYEVSWGTPVYPDSDLSLTIKINNLGPQSLRVSSLFLSFDWAPTKVSYSPEGLPRVIPSGGSATFTLAIRVPEGIGTDMEHVTSMVIFAADPSGTAWGEDAKWQSQFKIYVSKRPAYTYGTVWTATLGTATGPDYSAVFFLIVFVVLPVAFAITLLHQRRRASKAGPIKCRYCGSAVPYDSVFCPSCGHKLR